MKSPLEELMWDAYRAESAAALVHGFRGKIADVGDNITEIIDTPEEVNIYNAGASHGVAWLLNQLDDAGYVLTDRFGRKVTKDRFPSFKAAWTAWFRKSSHPPTLSVIK